MVLELSYPKLEVNRKWAYDFSDSCCIKVLNYGEIRNILIWTWNIDTLEIEMWICTDYLLVHNKLFPKFSGLKQQPFYCISWFCRSGIWPKLAESNFIIFFSHMLYSWNTFIKRHFLLSMVWLPSRTLHRLTAG